MPSCPSCLRPVALARASCLYCGAPLPADPAPDARSSSEPSLPPETERPATQRTLLVLDLAACAPEALATFASGARYEAELLARRGGFHVGRILPEERAESEAARLRAAGLATILVPESEARLSPLRALGGEKTPAGLVLRTEEGTVEIAPGGLLLVVSGPIRRERQASPEHRKVATATLDEGWRIHLHRASDPRPIEIDSANFEPGFAPAGSTRLELETWLAEFALGAVRDDGFRRLVPALAPAEPEPKGRLSAVSSLRTTRGVGSTEEGRASRGRPPSKDQILDNVAQFRFYSGWRGAVERRKREPAQSAGGSHPAPDNRHDGGA